MSATNKMLNAEPPSFGKKVALAVLPPTVAEWAKVAKRTGLLLTNYSYDFWRYAKYSSAVFRGNSEEKLRALITIHYHSLEKGLSLAKPRPGFGVAAVDTLMAHIDLYLKQYGPADHLSIPLGALKAYVVFNGAHGVERPGLAQKVAELQRIYELKLGEMAEVGGARRVDKAEIGRAIAGVDRSFFESRYSIRQFTPEPVDLELLKEATRRAQKSPAVCNRQSGKAWVIDGRENVNKALDIQKGARGFAEQVNKVIIITSDQCNFQSAGERYQSWIDGGLFAMSYIYALHSLGLGSCCLNWSMEHKRDRELRAAFNIPQTETIIMLLAVGHIPDELMVASSVRKPLEEAFCLVSSSSS